MAPGLHPSAWFAWALGLMVVLHVFLPLARLPSGRWRLWGSALLVIGILLHHSTAALFRRIGTTVRPLDAPLRLVETGPLRFTRNPMYLGGVLTLSGLWILMGSLTPLAVIPLFAGVVSRFIAAEERLLERRFGEEYRDYRSRVRRWL